MTDEFLAWLAKTGYYKKGYREAWLPEKKCVPKPKRTVIRTCVDCGNVREVVVGSTPSKRCVPCARARETERRKAHRILRIMQGIGLDTFWDKVLEIDSKERALKRAGMSRGTEAQYLNWEYVLPSTKNRLTPVLKRMLKEMQSKLALDTEKE